MQDEQQAAVDRLAAEFKKIALQILNETLDEIEASEPTNPQKHILNEFCGIFGKKLLDSRMVLTPNEGEENAKHPTSK